MMDLSINRHRLRCFYLGVLSLVTFTLGCNRAARERIQQAEEVAPAFESHLPTYLKVRTGLESKSTDTPRLKKKMIVIDSQARSIHMELFGGLNDDRRARTPSEVGVIVFLDVDEGRSGEWVLQKKEGGRVVEQRPVGEYRWIIHVIATGSPPQSWGRQRFQSTGRLPVDDILAMLNGLPLE